MKSFLLFACLLLAFLKYDVALAQGKMKDLYRNFNYGEIIRKYEASYNAAWADSDLLYTGTGYYKMGMVLIASYSANATFSTMNYQPLLDGEESKRNDKNAINKSNEKLIATQNKSKHTKSNSIDNFMYFAQAMNQIVNGDTAASKRYLSRFIEKADGDWKTRAEIWLHVLKVGLEPYPERLTDSQLFELYAARNILRNDTMHHGVKGKRGKNAQDLRNLAMIPGYLESLTDSQLIEHRKALATGNPYYSSGQGIGKNSTHHEYFDPIAPLAEARCSFIIAKSMLLKLNDKLQRLNIISPRYKYIKFISGHSSYLLKDYSSAIRLLEVDTLAISSSVLSGCYYKIGRKSDAEQVWQAIENGNNLLAKSWLGYILADNRIQLDRAEKLCTLFISTKNKNSVSQYEYYQRLAFVKESQGRYDRALDLYNLGYNYGKRSVIGYNGNDPEYTIRYCNAMLKVNKSEAYNVLEMLYPIQTMFDVGYQLRKMVALAAQIN